MNQLIFYNSFDIFVDTKNKDKLSLIPGGNNFRHFFHIFSKNITFVDRTYTVTSPLKCEILPHLQMPKFEEYSRHYYDICDERAIQLYNQAVESRRKLLVMYSGGIDSTLILCSLLKNINEKELKENTIVLLSDLSIQENLNFYYDHVGKKFNCVSSYKFPYYIGDDKFLFISGENADQLFGSQATGVYAVDKDYRIVFEPLEKTEGTIIDWMASRCGDKESGEKMYFTLKKITDNAPIKIDSIFKYFWWLNFTTKWQSVYVRMLPFSRNKQTLKLEENYTTFYHTKDFQLWAMNNANCELRSQHGKPTGKQVAKEYIFDYNGDLDYLNKPKIGSLSSLFKNKSTSTYIDSELNYFNDYPNESFYNYNNDFV
jgi:hypothetical protein